jgi:hypothetical protein
VQKKPDEEIHEIRKYNQIPIKNVDIGGATQYILYCGLS